MSAAASVNSPKKFGTIHVFLTAISTILGAVLFLRFGWAVGNVGFWGTLGIVLLGHLVTIPTALALAENGYELTVVYRNEEKLAALKNEMPANAVVNAVKCDLASLANVKAAADEILALQKPINVLVNNAGLITTHRQLSEDGHEMMLAANHIGPFLLTQKLLPLLRQSDVRPKVVNVASDAHKFVKNGVNLDDPTWEQGFKTFTAYGNSKLANMLFTLSMVAKHGDWLTVNCLHPGAVATGMGTQNGWFAKLVMSIASPFFRSPLRGASSSIWLASDPEGAKLQGAYVIDCKAAEAEPQAYDGKAAERLWGMSEQWVADYVN